VQKSIKAVFCDYENFKHIKAVRILLNAYISDEMGGGEPLFDEKQRSLIKGLKFHTKSIVLLACLNDEFVGLLIAFENFSTFLAKPMINIHDIIVLKEYRSKGVGRQLMNAVIDEAKKRDCVRITLEVREDNKIAQDLYKDLGFKETKPKMLYWRREL
jgi:ribosomal protein S18 acetylase RimI-like enzyme